jgi:hypothetical protein
VIYVVGYIALVVGAALWFVADARLTDVKLARAQLHAFKRRVRRDTTP